MKIFILSLDLKKEKIIHFIFKYLDQLNILIPDLKKNPWFSLQQVFVTLEVYPPDQTTPEQKRYKNLHTEPSRDGDIRF